MTSRAVYAAVRMQVIRQMKVIWRKYRGCYRPSSKPLMLDIPVPLRQDIAMEDYCWILTQCPLFEKTDESFLRALALKVVLHIFCPGQCIVYADDLAKEMYMIRRSVIML